MATEPASTSKRYDPSQIYTPPVGRLPVLGQMGAEIDRLRAEVANTLNTVINRDAAQADNERKITGELAALATTTADNTRKVDSDVAAQLARTTNETNKTTAEINALDQQTINDTQKTANDTARANNDSSRTINDNTNSTAKTDAEVLLLTQKTRTETAQIADLVDGTSVTGVIGKQKGLFQKQTDGFDRDAEQKLAKIMVDTWSVRQTTDGADPGQAGLAETDINTVLAKARTGIAAT